MKKITISIIGIIMYFIIFSQVHAAGTVSLSTSKSSVNIGDTFNVSINLSGTSVATLTARLSFDSQKVEYISGPSNSNYSGGRVIYTWTDPTGGSSPLTGGTIATFTFKAKTEGTVSFSVSGNFFTPEETSANPSFSGTTVSIKKVEVQKPSDNTTGNTGGTNTPNTNVGGNQTGNNQTGTTNSGNNNTSTGGSNTGSSNSGSSNTNTTTKPSTNNNTTNTNQQTTKSSNNNLKSLQLNVEGISPTFSKNKTQYYITIPENIANINVTAQPEDSKASVQVLGNTNIPVGNSQIKVIVTAENGSKKEYVINTTKTSNPELANANLENLAIENVTLTPEFSTDVTDYTAEIPNDIDKLNILAVPQQQAAKVTIEGNDNLQVGENYIKITILAEDGVSSKVYNVTVKKSEITNQQEENTNLSEDIQQKSEDFGDAMENETKKSNSVLIACISGVGILLISIVVIILKKKKV